MARVVCILQKYDPYYLWFSLGFQVSCVYFCTVTRTKLHTRKLSLNFFLTIAELSRMCTLEHTLCVC